MTFDADTGETYYFDKDWTPVEKREAATFFVANYEDGREVWGIVPAGAPARPVTR